MKIECTVEEFKDLLKKEQTECSSECSNNKETNLRKSKIGNLHENGVPKYFIL